MSRAEAGQLPITPAVRRLGPAIEDAVADVASQAEARGLTLANSVSGAAADLPYWGDEGRVRQILVNLLTNAIKFTGPGGRVTISGGTGQSIPRNRAERAWSLALREGRRYRPRHPSRAPRAESSRPSSNPNVPINIEAPAWASQSAASLHG